MHRNKMLKNLVTSDRNVDGGNGCRMGIDVAVLAIAVHDYSEVSIGVESPATTAMKTQN